MLKHKKSWTDKHTRLVQLVTIIGLFGVAALGTYTIHSGHASPISTGGTDNNACIFKTADQPVQVAFCESFNNATVNPPSGSRSGDLNNVLWGVSRVAGGTNFGQGTANYQVPTELNRCGTTVTVISPRDVQICNGILVEAQDDQHGVPGLTIYPKQPFDFAGRTGTIVFDVSDDSHGSHRAWPELWVTDKPVPGPFTHFSSLQSVPRNGFGIRFEDGCTGDNTSCWGRYPSVPAGTSWVTVGSANIVTNYISNDSTGDTPGNLVVQHLDAVRMSSGVGDMNHFEVRVSNNQIEVYGTDAGTTSPLRKLAIISNFTMPLSRGLVWMEDVHYNGDKDGPDQGTHTFSWDNFGFDGPKTYRDLAYDVPDNTEAHGEGINLGYFIGSNASRTFTVPNVTMGNPSSALLVFGSDGLRPPNNINYAINGHAHSVPWPYPAGYANNDPKTLDIAVPLSDIHDGDNTLTITNGDSANPIAVYNMGLIMVAAEPVPTATITPGNGGGTNPTPPPPNPPPGDTTPPTVSFNFTGFSTQPVDNAVVTDKRTVSMTISSSDASGIASTTATINGSPTTITNNSITTPNANGNYTIAVTVKDNANNTTTKTQTILIRHRDFSRNGVVDLLDLSQLLKAWNTSSTVYDFNNTTTTKLVDLFDLSFLMQQYGSSQ